MWIFKHFVIVGYIYICQKPEDVACFVHREIGKLNFTLQSDLDGEF